MGCSDIVCSYFLCVSLSIYAYLYVHIFYSPEFFVYITFHSIHYLDHHVDEVRHEHGRRLWFDVSEVPNDNYLMMAELRMYQNPAQGKWLTSGREFTITVYAIVNMEGQRELEVLSSVNTTSDYQGWLELNVTQGLDIWLHEHKSNKGLYIGAHAVNKPEREVKLDDIGLVHPKGDDEYQPFMIGFFHGPEVGVIHKCNL